MSNSRDEFVLFSGQDDPVSFGSDPTCQPYFLNIRGHHGLTFEGFEKILIKEIHSDLERDGNPFHHPDLLQHRVLLDTGRTEGMGEDPIPLAAVSLNTLPNRLHLCIVSHSTFCNQLSQG